MDEGRNTLAPVFDPELPEPIRVKINNRKHLARLGYGMEIDAIADDLDWHEVEALLKRGCTRELAVEICR